MSREFVINRQLSVARKQRGFALVSAIFILVVLAALGGYVVTVSTTQNASQGLDIQGSRAYQAARAGIEWGTYQILRNGANCPANASVIPAGTLADFTAVVQCGSQNFTEGANTVVVYQLVSTATYAAVDSPDYVQRQISSTISICTDPAGARC